LVPTEKAQLSLLENTICEYLKCGKHLIRIEKSNTMVKVWFATHSLFSKGLRMVDEGVLVGIGFGSRTSTPNSWRKRPPVLFLRDVPHPRNLKVEESQKLLQELVTLLNLENVSAQHLRLYFPSKNTYKKFIAVVYADPRVHETVQNRVISLANTEVLPSVVLLSGMEVGVAGWQRTSTPHTQNTPGTVSHSTETVKDNENDIQLSALQRILVHFERLDSRMDAQEVVLMTLARPSRSVPKRGRSLKSSEDKAGPPPSIRKRPRTSK
jgi:hypothetical protein